MGIFLNRVGVASGNTQYAADNQITTESFMYEDYVDDYSYAYADLMETMAMLDSGVADSVVTEAAGGFGAALAAFMNTVLGKVIVLIGVVIGIIIAFIASKNKDGGSGKPDKSDDKKSSSTPSKTGKSGLTVGEVEKYQASIADSICKGAETIINKAQSSNIKCNRIYADLITGHIDSVKKRLDSILKLVEEITKRIPEVKSLISDVDDLIRDIRVKMEDRHFGSDHVVITGASMLKDEVIKLKQKYDKIVGLNVDGHRGVFDEIKASIAKVVPPEDMEKDGVSVPIRDIKDASFNDMMSVSSAAKSVSSELHKTESLMTDIKGSATKLASNAQTLDASYDVARGRYHDSSDIIKAMNEYYRSYMDMVGEVRDTVNDMSTAIVASLMKIRGIVESVNVKMYNGRFPSFKNRAMTDALTNIYPTDDGYLSDLSQFVKKSDVETLFNDSYGRNSITVAILDGIDKANDKTGIDLTIIGPTMIWVEADTYLIKKFNLKE